MTKPMLTQVLEDLAACKGRWGELARELEPDNTVSFYSWLTKLAQGVIREPSVNRVQRLYDHFRAREGRAHAGSEPMPASRQEAAAALVGAAQASVEHREGIA